MGEYSQPVLKYLPLTKYDNVTEHFDGSITVNTHQKKRFLFAAAEGEKNFILDSLRGCLYCYFPSKGSLVLLPIEDNGILKGSEGISCFDKDIFTYIPSLKSIAVIHTESKEIKIVRFPYIPNALFAYEGFLWFIEKNSRRLARVTIQTLNEAEFLFECKGIGDPSFIIEKNKILITDSEENLLRVYSPDGMIKFEVITPYIDPIGIVPLNGNYEILYGGLINEVGYDNRCWQEQKAFFHTLSWHVQENDYTVTSFSNAFALEFCYEEHFTMIPDKSLFPLEIKLSLPPDNDNQNCIEVFPLGCEFIVHKDGNERYAVFSIPSPEQCPPAIGFKALMHTRSVKSVFPDASHVLISHENLFTSEELHEIDAESEMLKLEARINSPVCDWDKVKILRNRIYAQLRYKRNTHATSFEDIWKDGYGTCGDYTALMLNFLNHHHLSCQSVGGYKVPRFSNAIGEMRSAYYNHAWIEVMTENGKRIPVESSSDDKSAGDSFSEGQLGGVDWTHIKMYSGKAVPNMIEIKKPHGLHPFDILQSAVFFKLLGELSDDQF